MKKRIVLLTGFATLLLFAAVTGCKRGDTDYYGDVTFYNTDASLSDIIITVDNSQSDYIETYLSPNFCNQQDYANFNLSEGYHTYTAETVNGTYLGQFSFTVSGSCTFVRVRS